MTTSTVNLVQKPPPPPSQFLDERGYVSRAWINFLMQLQTVAKTALESSDAGTIAMLSQLAPQLISRLDQLEERVKALEIKCHAPPIQDSGKKVTEIVQTNLNLIEEKTNITMVNNISLQKEPNLTIQQPSIDPLYAIIMKRLDELEILIAVK